MNGTEAFWNQATLAECTEGRWLQRPRGEPETAWREGGQRLRLGTDSRTLEPGEIFLALVGEQFDGHRYLGEAIGRGASLLIVHDEAAAAKVNDEFGEVGVLLVDDTQRALAALARAHRRTLCRTRVIGITGSNGKTTAKRLLDAVLATKLRGSASQRSFNNHVGVPLTLLAAHPDDDYLIVEIGTNAPGEIATLTEIARPDIGVITGIGASHLEGLGTIEGVLDEKLDLFRGLPAGATAILNADAPLLRRAVVDDPAFAGVSIRTYAVAADDVELRAEQVSLDSEGTRFIVDGDEARLRLLGRHNVLNALAALAVAEAMNVDRSAALRGMADVEPRDMRLQVQRFGESTILNDAYNANPDSMRAALRAFAAITTSDRRRVLILGDMLELGASSEKAHADIAREIIALEQQGVIFHLVVLVGELMQVTAAVLAQDQSNAAVLPFPEGLTDADLPQIRALIARDDQILLKGSRRLALERIATNLEAYALARMS